ncbi:type II toxin-antitoxin system RelE/ParE family toxin [Candidatus Daviesbacteria bacterium]|nr:type II toxin-antitoxin system RelE/ParE family toxin [Candidatus Daviesbacteria bacterium]
MYQITISSKAEKHFARLPKNLQEKIAKKLKQLEENPLQQGLDIKKLAGTEKSYRLRAGELRILYQMKTGLKTILVVDIDFRRTSTY